MCPTIAHSMIVQLFNNIRIHDENNIGIQPSKQTE